MNPRLPVIGLKYGTVEVVPHCEEWAALFRAERDSLNRQLGGLVLDIQHVGSTAVPGLPAKPIIDIAVAIENLDNLLRIKTAMAALSYIYRMDAGEGGGHIFVKESSPQFRTHHVHFVLQTNPQWTRYLRFRDMLRSDPTVRESYAALKKELHRKYPGNRKEYTPAKGPFIRSQLEADEK